MAGPAELRTEEGLGLRGGSFVCIRWTPHPVIVTIMDNKHYIGVLLYSYYTTITGWGVLLMYAVSA